MPQALRQFIAGLALPESAKQALLELSPARYVGYAEQLAEKGLTLTAKQFDPDDQSSNSLKNITNDSQRVAILPP